MDTQAVSMLKLKLKLESKLKKRKELDSQIQSIQKEIEELEKEEGSVETDKEKLFKGIESLPEDKRKLFNREYSFTCSLCLKTYNEGFKKSFQLDIVLINNPELKEYSEYCLTHSRFSKCYKNQFCSICDAEQKDYNQFIHKTERTRHIKKHKDNGEKVLINKNDKTIEEIKYMYREEAENKKRCIVIAKKQKEQIEKEEEVYEQEDLAEEIRVKTINEQRQVEFEQHQDKMRKRFYEPSFPEGWTSDDERDHQLMEKLMAS